MKKIKFVVKLNRSGFRVPEYVQRIDQTPVQMTTNRKRALVMGRLTAEDVVKSIQTFQCIPELASVEVSSAKKVFPQITSHALPENAAGVEM